MVLFSSTMLFHLTIQPFHALFLLLSKVSPPLADYELHPEQMPFVKILSSPTQIQALPPSSPPAPPRTKQASGILASWSGIKPVPPAVEAWSLYWTARGVLFWFPLPQFTHLLAFISLYSRCFLSITSITRTLNSLIFRSPVSTTVLRTVNEWTNKTSSRRSNPLPILSLQQTLKYP